MVVLILLAILVTSCSFSQEAPITQEAPKLVIENATIARYEDGTRRQIITAELLERYSSKDVIAARALMFSQYGGALKNEVELKASAGYALLLESEKRYYLGGRVVVNRTEDNLRLVAQNLFYDGNTFLMQSGVGEKVELYIGNDTRIYGTDFIANSLSQDFSLLQEVQGSSNTSDDESEN